MTLIGIQSAKATPDKKKTTDQPPAASQFDPREEYYAIDVVVQTTGAILTTQDKLGALAGKTDPASTQTRQELTRKIEQQKGLVESAADQFDQSAKVQGAASTFWVQAGDYGKAYTRADRAVSLAAKNPQNVATLADAYKSRSLAAAAAGNYGPAHQDAMTALGLAPKDEGAMALAQMTDRSGRNIPGQLIVNGKSSAAPDNVKGRAFAPPPELQEAINAVRRSSTVNRPAGFAESVAKTKDASLAGPAGMGDYEEMHRKATAALDLLPQNAKARMQQAFASYMMGHFQDTVAEAGEGLKLRPSADSLLGLRAAGYNGLDRPGEALADAVKAVAANPTNPLGWLQKGLAREKLGEPPDNFLPDLKTAADLDTNYQHFYLEALARRDGKTATAIKTGSPSEAGSRAFWELFHLLPEHPTPAQTAIAAAAGIAVALGIVGLVWFIAALFKRRRD